MRDKIAKKSEASFGEPYWVRQNKSHEFFYCSVCQKNRRTNPIYYPDSNKSQLICADCYGKMFTVRYREAHKEAEALPEGTTIFVGKKAHRCKPDDGNEFEEKYYRLSDDKNRTASVCLLRCKNCGQLIVSGNKYNAGWFRKYNLVSSKWKTNEGKRVQIEKDRAIQILHRVHQDKCRHQ